MCNALKELMKPEIEVELKERGARGEILGAIKACKYIGMIEEDIVKNVLSLYDVTEDDVRSLMNETS